MLIRMKRVSVPVIGVIASACLCAACWVEVPHVCIYGKNTCYSGNPSGSYRVSGPTVMQGLCDTLRYGDTMGYYDCTTYEGQCYQLLTLRMYTSTDCSGEPYHTETSFFSLAGNKAILGEPGCYVQ